MSDDQTTPAEGNHPEPDRDGTVSLPPLAPGWEAKVDEMVAAAAEQAEAEPMPTYSRDNLPSRPDTWPTWRKVADTPMLRMEGPFSVLTQEGPLDCADGYLAVDVEGHPYAVKADPDTGYPLNYRPGGRGNPSPIEQRDQQARDMNELNCDLLQAWGLDPDKVQGARLTVMGGAFPTLEVWHVPPLRDGELTDAWVKPMAERVADTTAALLPGSGATVPPAEPRPNPVPPGFVLPAQLSAEHWLAQHLPMILDALNGAPVDLDTRDQLTAQGHQVAAEVESRVYMGMAQVPAPPPDEPI